MSNQILIKTLLDALNIFPHSGSVRGSSKIVPNLKTVFRKYILTELPGYQFTPQELIGKNLNYCLEMVKIEDFIKANPLKILDTACQIAVEEGRINKHIQRTTYEPALKKFLNWLQQQIDTETLSPQEQKYAPKREYGFRLDRDNRGRRVYHQARYALKESELPEKFVQQLKQMQVFCTGEFVPNRQDSKMRDITFNNHRQRALSFFGWLKNIQGQAPDTFDLKQAMDIDLLNQFIAWGVNEKGNTCGWASGFCDLALNVAKFTYAAQSKRPNYRDIEVIEEIRMINNQLHQQYEPQKKAAKKKKRAEREMTMEQCRAIVTHLRLCCNPRDSYGGKRSEIAIARSWLRYLLVAILTYCPQRQREIRELELGRTLHRTDKGYLVTLSPEDNKTGDERSFMLSDMLPEQVVQDLDEWLDVWIPKLKAATNNLNDWLAFIGRREYKSEQELEQYLSQLEQQLQQATELNDLEKIEELNKRLHSVKFNYQTQIAAKGKIKHNFLFFSLGNNTYQQYGNPIQPDYLFSIVKRAVYDASAALKQTGHPLFKDIEPRRTNPHYFRNIAITHERRHGDPAKRKAFHKVLGNSEAIGDQEYNEMHPEEKTVDAKNWWKPSDKVDTDIPYHQVLKLLPKLTPQEKSKLVQLLTA